VLQGRLGERLLSRLLDDDILRVEGDFYHWVPDSANRQVGISWQDLRRGQMSNELKTYLAAFQDANADLFRS